MNGRADLEARARRGLAQIADAKDIGEGETATGQEARWMVEALLEGTLGDAAPESTVAELDRMLARRGAGEPLQYVLGTWSFRSLELAVDPRALIPRPETEGLIDVALTELQEIIGDRRDPIVVDLGTGTGAIALSMATEMHQVYPQGRVTATDIDPDTLDLARRNAKRVEAQQARDADIVEFHIGDWYDALPVELVGNVDLILSNPPYIAASEWDDLATEVRHEPRGALVAGTADDGTPGGAAIEVVLNGAGSWLRQPGAIVVEIAPHQARAAASMAERAGFDGVRIVRDLAGMDRLLIGRRS